MHRLVLAANLLALGASVGCASRAAAPIPNEPFNSESPIGSCYIDLRGDPLPVSDVNEALVSLAKRHWETTPAWGSRPLLLYKVLQGSGKLETFYVFHIAGVDGVYAVYAADFQQTSLRRYFTHGSMQTDC